MTKKKYMKPAMEILEADLDQQLLAYSVQSDGLGENREDELTQDETPGNAWGDAW